MEVVKMEKLKSIVTEKFELTLGQQGNLLLSKQGKSQEVEIRPCFPWSNKVSFLSLRDKEGVEQGFVSSLEDLDLSSQKALLAVLGEAQFCFEINDVLEVEEEFELRTWLVETKQGQRSFQTNLVDWPYTLPNGSLVIKDVGGDLYVLSSTEGINKKTKKLVEAFLD